MPLFNTLYAKLAIGLATTLVLVGLSYTLFAGFLATKLNQSTQQTLSRDLAQNLVSDNKIVKGETIDKNAMKDTFMMYMSINPDIEIYYTDLQGTILEHSAEPGKVRRDKIDVRPILEFISGSTVEMLLGDDPRGVSLQKPFSVTPIPNGTNPQGYLYVVLHGEQYTAVQEAQSSNYLITLGGSVLGGSLLLGLAMGLFIFRRLTLRLRTLKTQVSDFVASDFQQPKVLLRDKSLTIKSDEIAELHNDIAQMSALITDQWAALKQQDKLRREMVANISHDLRTPLTSIQGYLETLALKGDDIDAEKRDKYLSIAIRQSRRLHKLVDDLLELAKLDAREHRPVLESFPIMELIYDVVNKLSIRADEKNITVKVDSLNNNPRVIADLGLIERVLDNLLGNAIYYTGENGVIEINADTPKDGRVLIRVSDSGKGIPPSQHKLVFERFHQAHTKDRTNGHAGLGLSIVRKILELHEQKVWVNSEVDKGAEFNFTLTAA